MAVNFENNPSRAIDLLNQAIQLDPDFPLCYVLRGNLSALSKDYDRAIKDFETALRLDPTISDEADFDVKAMLSSVYVDRGTNYGSIGNVEQALSDTKNALQLNPHNEDARNNLGVLYVDRGIAHTRKKEFDKARADFEEALRLDPTDPDAQKQLGLMKMLQIGSSANKQPSKGCESIFSTLAIFLTLVTFFMLGNQVFL